MKAIIDALNVAYEEKEKRSFIRLNLISLVMTLVAMVSLMLMLGAVVAAADHSRQHGARRDFRAP